MKQEMNIDAPPRGNLPQWGRRVRFEKFLVELVPAGKRSFNVRIAESFASISFGPDEGKSSLAGDRLRRYDRRPYEYIVVPPSFPLRGQSDAAPEVLAFVFRFEEMKPDIAAALQISESVLEPRVIIGGPKSFTTEIAQRIRRHMLTDNISRDYLMSLCLTLIFEMVRLPPGQTSSGRGTKLGDGVLRMVLDFVEGNLDGDVSVDVLAQMSGVLTHQFTRAFKRKIGQPPHQYVLTRRLETARTLLNTTQRPIADIAYSTGFSSQSHMTTTFKRELGVTPAQLRGASAG